MIHSLVKISLFIIDDDKGFYVFYQKDTAGSLVQKFATCLQSTVAYRMKMVKYSMKGAKKE
jgi:hypothetical protein